MSISILPWVRETRFADFEVRHYPEEFGASGARTLRKLVARVKAQERIHGVYEYLPGYWIPRAGGRRRARRRVAR
jgi:hypothetical protein